MPNSTLLPLSTPSVSEMPCSSEEVFVNLVLDKRDLYPIKTMPNLASNVDYGKYCTLRNANFLEISTVFTGRFSR